MCSWRSLSRALRAHFAAASTTHDGTGPHLVHSVHACNIHLLHQLGNNSDATDNATNTHQLCQCERLADNDNNNNSDSDDNSNNNSNDDMVPQLHKCTAARTHYNADSGRTSNAHKAEKNASAASTTKGKGRLWAAQLLQLSSSTYEPCDPLSCSASTPCALDHSLVLCALQGSAARSCFGFPWPVFRMYRLVYIYSCYSMYTCSLIAMFLLSDHTM